ncbi:hypothetical protein D3C76_47830 [compost metagenome]
MTVALLVWWMTATSCEAETPLVLDEPDALRICLIVAAEEKPKYLAPGDGVECVIYDN